MPRDKSKARGRTAADLLMELQKDPAFQQREAERAAQTERNVQAYAAAAEGLMDALSGCVGTRKDLSDLTSAELATAGRVLVEWLPRIYYLPLKNHVVHTLSKPGITFNPSPALLREFRSAEKDELRWSIASALSDVATDAEFAEIAELAQDESLGQSREMLALALGRMNRAVATPVLVNLLKDEVTVGHAVIALGELRARDARAEIEGLLEHPKAWVRKEAHKALRRL